MTTSSASELIALQEAVAGRYSIERELGRGGMGVVYLARDAALERQVAIKTLPPNTAGDAGMRERFVREARTAAKLSHPNIVPIHAVEEHGDIVFFVMGFVDGETLTARVRRAGPLGSREAGKLIQEIAWALAYAHSAGVIHRDVKADNILIDRASGRALLTDFGIARVTGGGQLTAAGEMLGTAQYVSPEQLSGGVIDGRSDLYSLGVTAFFALTGRLPFEGQTMIALIGMHLTQPAPPLATIRDGLPPKLTTAIDRCLAKDPADRFRTGEQLADAIADARSGVVEVSPMVRAFLRDRARVGAELAAYLVAMVYLQMFAGVMMAKMLIPVGALAALSIGRLVASTTRLLRSGFGFDDVRAAILSDAAAREEEIQVAAGGMVGAAAVRRRRFVGIASLGLVVFAVHGIGNAVSAMHERAAAFALVLGCLGIVSWGLGDRTEENKQRSRKAADLWGGAFGKWFFRLAGLAVRSTASQSASPAHTEVLLAKAAADLFAALPSHIQASVGADRAVIARLQSHVERLRKREEQLAAAVAQAGEAAPLSRPSVGGGADAALDARRQDLLHELASAKDSVSARRASAIAALENIRLQLLRLQAGIGTAQDLTADIAAAANLEREISALVAGYDEVSAMR
jgi:predicted Ser/Thr protein kinase